ncbi:hypothetical protein XAC3810_730126 [Xanthomonas citri pv. citri]|uniref:Uncharacterized protein n=1 Tax=Xanthomonas citri pv. citri TaxID=611301 RepID=A0A0U4YR43_XANCI|nr:hypothetical protein XAC902_1040130 [Xanthomonas citri pv. citri]CEE20835.1 hypothetical protein XAC908_1030077 [Xanthomonas citri pv. citri]CEE37759.1 hypothetical protein XAC9322_700126 [Xanthomonas citri pv. citri]CEE37810.1 hypothetical protein XAC3824_880128 [Xanthomonas citri pv. citri]CEE39027.1 hypothetical protein XAC1083_720127 [Xanthomonas citri pv. citri]
MQRRVFGQSIPICGAANALGWGGGSGGLKTAGKDRAHPAENLRRPHRPHWQVDAELRSARRLARTEPRLAS